jgi:hypothetical protein
LDIKKLIKSLLFIFVALSFAVFIYKDFSPRGDTTVTGVTVTAVDPVPVPDDPVTAPEGRLPKKPVTKQGGKDPLSPSDLKSKNSKVIAYYFHGTFRCTTCRTIEQYSHDAIQTYFAEELENGKLEFRPVNIEEPENKHFIQDYQLVTRSLVLSLVSDGKEKKWKNLADVWRLVRDKDRFFRYVNDEVEIFLKESG